MKIDLVKVNKSFRRKDGERYSNGRLKTVRRKDGTRTTSGTIKQEAADKAEEERRQDGGRHDERRSDPRYEDLR